MVVPSPRSLCSMWIPAWNAVTWFGERASCSIRALCVTQLTLASYKQPTSFSGTFCSQFVSKQELQSHPQPFPLMLTLQHEGKAAHCSPVSVMYPHHISWCATTECVLSLINNNFKNFPLLSFQLFCSRTSFNNRWTLWNRAGGRAAPHSPSLSQDFFPDT